MQISYSKQFIDEADIHSVVKCLKSNLITQGPYVNKFEKKIAKYVGSKYAVAVSSCTAGLHLSLKAIDLKSHHKILTSVISFVSSANVSQYLNANIDFIDIDLDTISMNLKMLNKKIDNNVRAIIPVHMAGAAYNEKEIYQIAKKNKIKVIEDCAHALGAKYKDGSMVGSCRYSDISVFSFHPVKSITTGEGGIITTNNRNIYQKLLRLRSHGINKGKDNFLNKNLAYTNKKKNSWYYEMRELGYHYRLTDIQSALGISQLDKINKFIKRRREISNFYDKEFSNINGFKFTQSDQRKNTAGHLYVLRIDYEKFSTSREEFLKYLRKNKIICQVHYIPIVCHPYYEKLGFDIKNYPNAKKYYDECISIPCYYSFSIKQQKYTIKKIKTFFLKIKKINILLFGGSGLLGSNILKKKEDNFNIFSYKNTNPINKKKTKVIKFDLSQKSLQKFIKKENISIIINASGLTSLEECEINKNQAINSNTKIVQTILKSIANTNKKLVHISTDHIFDKKKGKISENEKTKFKNFYSKTKILAEREITKSKSNFLIIRSNFFGKGLNNRISYSDYIIKNLKNKKYLSIWNNIYFAPVNLDTLVKFIFCMINDDLSGIYNLSSNQKISKFQFAHKVAKLKKLNKKFIVSKKFISKKEKIDRPLNMFLDNKKIIKIFPQFKKDLDLSNQIKKI